MAVLGTTIVVWSGVVALRAMGAQATALYTSTALPLADLAQVRDGIGDARRDVRDLAVGVADARPALLAKIHATDQAVDAALDAYLHQHGDL